MNHMQSNYDDSGDKANEKESAGENERHTCVEINTHKKDTQLKQNVLRIAHR